MAKRIKKSPKSREWISLRTVSYNGLRHKIVCPSKSSNHLEHRDNGRNYNSTWYGSCWNPVRVPSLKRSKTTWKRFYHLFPEFYTAMKELAAANPDSEYVEYKYKTMQFAETESMVKLKVMDIDKELNVLSGRLEPLTWHNLQEDKIERNLSKGVIKTDKFNNK